METGRNIRGDLETRSSLDLTPTAVLLVTTSKRHGGKVSTDAAVHTRERGFLSHQFTMFSKNPLESDFRRTLATETARATAKTLEAQHVAAIEKAGGLEALGREALAHQQAREAYLAEQAKAA